MDILDLIKKRHSPRAFSSDEITEELINKLFEAAQWAASAYNEQPWHFYYATKKNPDAFNKLIECMTDFNQEWAVNAYMLVLTTAKKKFEHNCKENKHAWYDLGQSVANMAIEATSLGLFMHQMSGFSVEKAKKLIRVPNNYEPVSMIAVGYKGDVEILPRNIKEMEGKTRKRKDLNTIISKL